MITSEIITKFELHVDDNSSLSSDESLDLANKVYRKVIDYKPWEWLKKERVSTLSVIASQSITLPTDFKYLAQNKDDAYGEHEYVVFVGSELSPYKVVPFSKRRNHRDSSGYCYIDIVAGKLKFTSSAANGKTVEFDYIYQPDALTTATSPVFPTRFHDIIFHGMAIEFAHIDNTPKERSYVEDHVIAYNDILQDMSYENSKLYGATSY